MLRVVAGAAYAELFFVAPLRVGDVDRSSKARWRFRSGAPTIGRCTSRS